MIKIKKGKDKLGRRYITITGRAKTKKDLKRGGKAIKDWLKEKPKKES